MALGVTGPDVAGAPQPAPLSATTVKVYVVPLARPVTVHSVEDVRHDEPPGEAVT